MICVPIVAKHTEEAIKKIGKANNLADMLEIRLDFMESFSLAGLMKAAVKPTIITYRSKNEGGCNDGDYERISQYLLDAVEAHAAFVDVEYGMPADFRNVLFKRRGKSKIIISVHIMTETPSIGELQKRFDRMAATGADVVKIVTQARAFEDNMRALNLIERARKRGVNIIAFCMGPLGRFSRIASVPLGGYLTFASLEGGEESADGQIPVRKMKHMLENFAR